MSALASVVSGVLVTTRAGNEVGREKFHDDGETLRSEITILGQSATVTLRRSSRQVVVEAGGKTITREVPEGTLALENGNWQAYVVAAEQYPDAREPVAVKVLLPASGVTVDGKLRVTAGSGGARHVELQLGPVAIEVDVAASGAVTHAAVPLQGLDVRPEGTPSPKVTVRLPPVGVVEEPLEIERAGAKVRGVLWRAAKADGMAKPPLAIIIAGSGPTDRDCNGPMLRTDCYRQLAEGLARAGVASIRYDKRGIGASDPVSETELTFDDYVADAADLVALARREGRFSKVTVIGHSEGGLVGLLLAQKVPLDGLVLLAAAGRPLGDVIHEQLARQLAAPALAQADAVIAALRDGTAVPEYPPALAALFRPSVQKYLRSQIAIDPAAVLAKLSVPVAIVQGETDVQVSVADARRLAAARQDAHLALLPRVNHVLKEERELTLEQESYTDPSRPLGPGVLDAVLAGLARP